MTSLPPNKKDDSTESFLQRGMNKELLNCCFERYYLSVVGVIIGTIVGIKKKSVIPLGFFGIAGNALDVVEGYYGPCKHLREDFNRGLLKAVKEEEEKIQNYNKKDKDF